MRWKEKETSWPTRRRRLITFISLWTAWEQQITTRDKRTIAYNQPETRSCSYEPTSTLSSSKLFTPLQHLDNEQAGSYAAEEKILLGWWSSGDNLEMIIEIKSLFPLLLWVGPPSLLSEKLDGSAGPTERTLSNCHHVASSCDCRWPSFLDEHFHLFAAFPLLSHFPRSDQTRKDCRFLYYWSPQSNTAGRGSAGVRDLEGLRFRKIRIGGKTTKRGSSLLEKSLGSANRRVRYKLAHELKPRAEHEGGVSLNLAKTQS